MRRNTCAFSILFQGEFLALPLFPLVIDTLAPNISTDLEGCIRILVTYQEDVDAIHVYLNEAKNLRPDR